MEEKGDGRDGRKDEENFYTESYSLSVSWFSSTQTYSSLSNMAL